MSNRQERKARKAAQREGTEVFVHVKPTARLLGPLRLVRDENGMGVHFSGRQIRQRHRRYEREVTGRREVKVEADS